MKSSSSDRTSIGASATSPFHDVCEVLDPMLFLGCKADTLLIRPELIGTAIRDHFTSCGYFLTALVLLSLEHLLLGNRSGAQRDWGAWSRHVIGHAEVLGLVNQKKIRIIVIHVDRIVVVVLRSHVTLAQL